MLSWLNDLLADTSRFMPHGYCYLWRPVILWLHAISDAIIALAYFSIPFALFYFVRKRIDLNYRWVFVLFGAFILLCGTTHLMSIWTIWHPSYLAEGLIKSITALVSILTAVLLWPLIPKLLLLPSPQALKTSESYIRAIFNATPDAMLISNELGIIRMVNQQAEQMLGYKASELQGQSIEMIVPHQFRKSHIQFREHFDPKAANNLKGKGRELLALKKDNSEIDVDISLSPILTEQGLFFASALRDITFRKQVELKLRIAAAAFESQESMVITDANSVILQVNKAFTESTGYTTDEVVGQKMNLLHSGIHDKAFYDAIWECIERNGSWQGEIWDQRKNREHYLNWATITAVKGEDGVISNYVGTHIDITQRKRNETELLKLASALEQSSESVIITNLDAEIEYVNAAFLRNSGYSREEVMGQNPRFLKSGKTQSQSYHAMWDALLHGRLWQGEFINKNKDGTERVKLATISPLTQANGDITHYVDVMVDITEKKRIDLELDQHRHHLEALVASRTKALESALSLADSANQAKSAFLANMSHEIRTPMNAIIGLTYLLQKSTLSAEQSRKLQQIEQSSQHLLSIINDILDLSKIEAHQMQLEQTDFALGSLLDHICSLVSHQVQAKAVTITVDCGDVPAWLRGDYIRLRQALLNYVSNALKFTEQGSIWLRTRLLEETEAGLLIRFEVQDTGMGIAEDKLTMLFEAFSQVDVSTTRQYGGTGLGLAITRRLANLMGGTVGVESVPEQGSLFWFTAVLQRGHGILPGYSQKTSTQAEFLLRQHYAGAQILLVEDNVINREVAIELLNGVGLSVDTAETGREAIDKIRNQAYQLVLMDVQMPEMDGLEATKIIRAEGSQIPILAMTANAFNHDQDTCLTVGMNDVVAKPFSPEMLYVKVYHWLSRAAQL